MRRIKIFSSPWGLTLPILLLFLVDIWILGKNVPLSDGIRYWQTASDILDGFRNTPVLESWLLLNGPLYPLILALFKGIGFSVKASLFLNAAFLYVGFTYFLKTSLHFLNRKTALWVTYILVFVDPFLFYWGAKLYSEPLAILWVCLLLYLLTKYYTSPKRKTFLQAAFIFCLLALTRVIFAYVLLAFILLGFLGYFLSKKELFKSLGKLGSYGLLFCLPYLFFTYSITNKVFYWSGNGGHLLYNISSPYPMDLGQWHTLSVNYDNYSSRPTDFSSLNKDHLKKVNENIVLSINKNHKVIVDSLKGKSKIEFDSFLKSQAILNIKSNPLNFLTNWILNAGRLSVGIPQIFYYTPPYTPLFTLVNTVKSSFLLCFFLVAVGLFIRNFSVNNFHLVWMLLLLVVYLGGQSLLAVQSQRFLLPVYPLILMFIALSFSNYLQFKKPTS